MRRLPERIFRRFFRRRLLPKLAVCAWKAVAAYIRNATFEPALPAAIVAIQTAGDFLNWHPHLHILAPAGAFLPDGRFIRMHHFDASVLRELFQAHVFALLVKERMVSDELVDRMKSWRHSGFHAFAGDEIPDIDNAVRVGLYMVRGPVAASRLLADPAQEPRLRYLAKGAGNDHSDVPSPTEHQDFDYLEWIARVTSHIPEPGAQLVHYYGAYSNAHRGIAKRREAFTMPDPDAVPESRPAAERESGWIKARRKSWARLIRRDEQPGRKGRFPLPAATGKKGISYPLSLFPCREAINYVTLSTTYDCRPCRTTR